VWVLCNELKRLEAATGGPLHTPHTLNWFGFTLKGQSVRQEKEIDKHLNLTDPPGNSSPRTQTFHFLVLPRGRPLLTNMGITVLAIWLPIFAQDNCAQLFQNDDFVFNGFGCPWIEGYNYADTLGLSNPVSSEDCSRMRIFVAAYKKAYEQPKAPLGKWMKEYISKDTNKPGKERLEKWLNEVTGKVKLNAQIDKLINWDNILNGMVAAGYNVRLKLGEFFLVLVSHKKLFHIFTDRLSDDGCFWTQRLHNHGGKCISWPVGEI
jgi:hypothetical protein